MAGLSEISAKAQRTASENSANTQRNVCACRQGIHSKHSANTQRESGTGRSLNAVCLLVRQRALKDNRQEGSRLLLPRTGSL